MALGLRNVLGSFSCLVRKLFAGLKSLCDVYLNDVTIFSVSWDNHLDHLRQVLSRVKLAQLTLNLKIYVFAHAEIDFVGPSCRFE